MSEHSREKGPLMQSGGIRENFPEQVILSFLLKREVKHRPARENGTCNLPRSQRECSSAWLFWLEQRAEGKEQLWLQINPERHEGLGRC